MMNNMVGNNFINNNNQPFINTQASNNSNNSNNSMNKMANKLVNDVILQMNNNMGNNNIMNMNNNKNKININNNISFQNNSPDLEFLINGCGISLDKLDSKGNNNFRSSFQRMTGPNGYLKKYKSPKGWKGFGLKVMNQYGNDDWIGNSNSPGEWYIGYHGTRSMSSVNGIINQGFRRGNRQTHEQSKNTNPLTNKKYPLCGIGVYFTPDIDEAKKYTEPIYYNGYHYKVVFMCRINPYKVRIHSNPHNPSDSLLDYFIVNGVELKDDVGTKRDYEVRPYRILLIME